LLTVRNEEIKHNPGQQFSLALLPGCLIPRDLVPALILPVLIGPVHPPEQGPNDIIPLPVRENERLPHIPALGVNQDLLKKRLHMISTRHTKVITSLGTLHAIEGVATNRGHNTSLNS
jgi:hypothetical protein